MIWRKARKKPVIVEFREPMFEVEEIYTREGTLIARRGREIRKKFCAIPA